MNKLIYKLVIILSLILVSCDDANDLLNQYIKDGPIIYAAKLDSVSTYSGYYRFQVNLQPAEDVNRSHCILSWNVSGNQKDSVKIDYTESNFNQDSLYYSHVIDLASAGIQGNLAIYAQNVDIFGNRSLYETQNAYIYGEDYLGSLLNTQVSFSSEGHEVIFEPKVGAVGNLLSYEQEDGSYTEEVLVTESRYPLIDAKTEGVVRIKTIYRINPTDIDTLMPTEYLEVVIP